MQREIPGTINIEGRKYLYLEFSDIKEFTKLFPKIGTFENSKMPKFGGMISENVSIELPDNNILFGVSYKGDLKRWERKIIGYCNHNNLLYGEMFDKKIILSNKQSFLIEDCKIDFY